MQYLRISISEEASPYFIQLKLSLFSRKVIIIGGTLFISLTDKDKTVLNSDALRQPKIHNINKVPIYRKVQVS